MDSHISFALVVVYFLNLALHRRLQQHISTIQGERVRLKVDHFSISVSQL